MRRQPPKTRRQLPQRPGSGDAPADESFGHIHMSVLGIRNFLNDADKFATDAAEDVARDILHKTLFVEECFRDWQSKYPHDSWILRLGSRLNAVYEKLDAALPYDDSHLAAIHRTGLVDFLNKNFPANKISSK
jgi:hypothetical protein